MSRKYDYIRYKPLTGEVFCERCGDSYIVNLPCPLDVILAIMKAYKKIHAHCKAKVNGNVA